MSHSSALETSGQRFLSLALQHALSDKWLSPEDFANTFSPEVIMAALEKAPELRSRLLVEAAGVHERIAPKKSTAAAAEDLHIALSEGVSTPAVLIELFGIDDRVRYLDNDELWKLYTRDQFWTQSSDRARKRLHEVIAVALDQGLIQLREIVDAVTPARLAADLPKSLLERALTRAIESGAAGAAFDAEGVFDALPLQDWVTHVPLPLLWEKVVVEKVLPATGVLSLKKPEENPEPSPDGGPSGPSGAKTGGSGVSTQVGASAVKTSGGEKSLSVNGLKGKSSEKESSSDVTQVEVVDLELAVTEVEKPKSVHPADESEARQRAIENLLKIDRLPPRAAELATPLLLAIDGMYAELLTTSDEEERAQLIRDAFPNPQLLEEGLFAVAQALDPRLNEEALRARGAEGDALITLVLFEERRRANGRSGPGSEGRSLSQPPGPVVSVEGEEGASLSEKRSSAIPPPLPPASGNARRSIPPPPLPVQAPRGRLR